MEQMTIGEVAAQVGLRTSAIRFYERVGLLPTPQRLNGRRRYEGDVLQKIRLIQIAQHAGFTVREIRVLLYEFPAETPPSVRWQQLANPKLEEIEVLLSKINTMKVLLEHALKCQCPTLNECASKMGNDNHNPDVQRLCDLL